MDTSKPIDPSDLFSAKDLTIVITGAGSGIGLAFATALAHSNASKIYILGRRLPALTSAAHAINPTTVIPIQCDVTSAPSIAAAELAIRAHGSTHIDVLINNAGITGPNHTDLDSAASIAELQAIMQRDAAAWTPTWETNAAAVIAVSAAFLPLLDAGNARRGWVRGKRETQGRVATGVEFDAADQRTSQIVTVASISAFNRKVTAGLAYTASKAGAVALAKSLAFHLAPWGIRSNVVAPGRFPSEMTVGGATVFPVNQIPHGTQGEYEDMAAVILYLVGRSGAYVNGNVQILDGGRLSVMPG